MTRILAIADEVDEGLHTDKLARLRPDLVVSCGDLPFDYLEYVVSTSTSRWSMCQATTTPRGDQETRYGRRCGPNTHGHVHPYGRTQPERRLAGTQIINAVPVRLIDL